jgi:hypothetical protein
MYTYAFLLDPASPLDLPDGIAGSLQLMRMNHLAALVEPDLASESLQTNDENLMQAVLAHDRVIRAAFQQATVLPLRFGTCFVSRQALLEHLASHSAEYLDKLVRLQNKVEYPLKLVPIASAEPPLGEGLKGKDYFLAKKQLYQAQAEWQQQQQAELERLTGAIAQTYPDFVRSKSDDGVERIYLLGDRQRERLLYQSFKTWQTECPHWQFSLGEALPPYHFV